MDDTTDHESVVNTLLSGSEEINRMKQEIKTIADIALGLVSDCAEMRRGGQGFKFIIRRAGQWVLFPESESRKARAEYWAYLQGSTLTCLYSSEKGCHASYAKKVKDTLPEFVKGLRENPSVDFSRRAWPYIEAADIGASRRSMEDALRS